MGYCQHGGSVALPAFCDTWVYPEPPGEARMRYTASAPDQPETMRPETAFWGEVRSRKPCSCQHERGYSGGSG